MFHHATIVVAERDPMLASMFAEALSDAGYYTYAGVEQRGLVEAVDRIRPQLILLDVERDNAIEVVTLIRNLYASSLYPTAILACSTNYSLANELAASLSRFRCVMLLKPCELDQLYTCVEMMLDRYALAQYPLSMRVYT